MRFGIFSLGDHLPNPLTGEYNESQSAKHLGWVSEGILADHLGYSSIWLGEHHFNEYILSVPQMVLAAIAMKTERIRLGTAVTLIANHDPVRIAEDFATLDLLSKGRAEIGVASGITPSTFKLFGQSMENVPLMLLEKVELLETLWNQQVVRWRGNYRAPFEGARVEPRTYHNCALPIWMGTGVSIDKAKTAGRKGFKLQLATIFGNYADFAPVAAAYREAYLSAGHPAEHMEVAAIAYCYVNDESSDPYAEWAPFMAQYRYFMKDLVRGHGLTDGIKALAKLATNEDLDGGWRPFDLSGSSDSIAERILMASQDLGGIDHMYLYFDCGGMPQAMVERSISQFGQLVIPKVNAWI